MIAAVGTDGTRMVVWGIGGTRYKAEQDARNWLDGYDSLDLEYHRITKAQASVIMSGDVSWPVGCPVDK